MTIEYIRYRIPPDGQDTFLQAYRKAAVALNASAYCLAYELAHCEEEPERFILRIEWSSTVEHLQGFRTSTEFRDFFAHIRPYVQNIEEMQHYQLTDIVSRYGR